MYILKNSLLIDDEKIQNLPFLEKDMDILEHRKYPTNVAENWSNMIYCDQFEQVWWQGWKAAAMVLSLQ